MNILITKNKDIRFLFKIYYFISLLIVLSVLTSLIFTNSFYQKSVISINTEEKDLPITYIGDLHTSKSLQQNKLIDNFQIDQVRKTKTIPNITVVKLPKDLKSIKSIKKRKELFIKITLPLIIQENNKLLSLNKKIRFIKSNIDQISRKEAVWAKI